MTRPVYSLRLSTEGAHVLEEAVAIPSASVPLSALVAALHEVAAAGTLVEVVELDPTTGAPKRPTVVERALDELLGDLQ